MQTQPIVYFKENNYPARRAIILREAGMEWIIAGAAQLLSAGPLGLGAIVVIVTGHILTSGKPVERGRLTLAMSMLKAGSLLVVVGLVVLLIQAWMTSTAAKANEALAEAKAGMRHNVYFRVEPLHLVSGSKLPPAVITVDGKELQNAIYTVDKDSTVIVDVSGALESKPMLPPTLPKPEVGLQQRNQLIQNLETSIAQAQRIPVLMNQACPGGSHGRNPFNYDSVVSLTSDLVGALNSTKNAIASTNM
jgi:hypothetical protein